MDILLVGCGRMGGAMARGWEGRHRVFVHDPMVEDMPAGAERVAALDAFEPGDDLAVVLAVKPQMFVSVAAALKPLRTRSLLAVSIMAGIPLAALGEAMGDRVIRAMPNTPAAIGKGITAAVAGAGARTGDRDIVDMLLAPTGAVVWLDAEAQIDAVTALSGSGPAYFFRFTEALAKAGADEGLPPALAMQLARATFSGAAALADADAASLADLRVQVTSPGGTTAAGLAQMNEQDAIDRLARSVVEAAAARSRELAG